jgi:hypothetical protein
MGIKAQDGTTKHYLRFMRVFTTQLQVVQTALNAFIALIQYRLYFSSQIIYLQRYLNDQFDAIPRRIYIVNENNAIVNYIFNKAESPAAAQKRYLFNKSEAYDNTTAYVLGDIVTYGGKVYRALGATTGNLPTNTTKWVYLRDVMYLFNKGERSADYNFRVYVPNILVIDADKLDDEIQRYIFSGIKYEVVYY